MRKCEIWALTSEGQELMGNVLLDGTILSSESTPGNADAIADLMVQDNIGLNDARYRRETQPVEWFEALPIMYHGTYMWAEMA